MTLAKGRIDRAGQVAFGDASLSVWEEGIPREWNAKEAWERAFKREVFARIVQMLNRLGWTCEIPAVNPHDIKNYSAKVARWGAERHRICSKGDLKGELHVMGRSIKFEMWQGINTPTRPDHGGRYEFDKEDCMPYLLRLEMERTRRRIRDYLCNVFTGYVFEQTKPKMGFNGVTALEFAAYCRRTSGHYVADLDRAKICNAGYDKSADGHQLENGTRVYALDRHGRIVTGIAFYSLNGQWQIVTGRYDMIYVWHKQIWIESPGNVRTKRNASECRTRIERELQKAVGAMDFERAAVLRDILFPGTPQLFAVWHEEHEAYHCAGFSGYTKDLSKAGRFTASEVRGWDRKPNKVISTNCAAEAA